jgi:hypothetical protein
MTAKVASPSARVVLTLRAPLGPSPHHSNRSNSGIPAVRVRMRPSDLAALGNGLTIGSVLRTDQHGAVAEALLLTMAVLLATAALSLVLTRNSNRADTDAAHAALSSSTTSSKIPRSTGTLVGRVTAGPTCPVERAGHPCPPRPVAATVQARTTHGQVVGSTHTDPDGRYRLELRPGRYTVVAVTPKAWPRCSPTTATVTVHHTTRAVVSCDTGIR